MNAKSTSILTLTAVAALTGALLQAQNIPYRAAITGGGSRDEGKCTIEVVVDAAADVQVRGDTAYLHTLRGQPAEWRRFQCNMPMPANPAGLRFQGVDGRGRQQLLSTNPVVVRIEDRDSGREGYTFDLFWRTNGQYGGPGGAVQPGYPYDNRPGGFDGRDNNVRGPDFDDRRGDGRPPFDALRVCQDAVAETAFNRFRARPFSFRDVHFEPLGDPRYQRSAGRVVGFVDLPRGRFDEWYRFTCPVDLYERRVGRIDFARARDWR